MSINSCTLSGNITRDPELRATQGGSQILRFGIAVNERRKDASGNWGDYANFFDCVMFGSRAEKVAQYLSKGTKVTVSGPLHYSSWERDGQKRSKVELYVNDLEFMSSRQQQSGYQQQGYQQGYAPQPAPAPAPAPAPDLYDENLPF